MPEEKSRRRATIHDVAYAAGLSAATVSKVLRGSTTVKSGNIAKVKAAVERLDYRMDPVASGLRNERRRIIGAVVPDLESPFFGALATGLERAAEAAGYAMILASSRESEAREADLVARMNDWRVAGTVLAPVRSERGLGAGKLRDLDMRAVLVDRVSADDRYDTVTSDNRAASAAAADFLIDGGHRRILLHGATRVSKAVRTRHEGFVQRARDRGPDIEVDVLISDDSPETQRRALRDYLDARLRARRPSAIFSLSQQSTLLVLSELRRRGVDIPGQIALAGFDDADWMRAAWPSITAVAQPVAAMAERAVAVLLSRVERGKAGFPVQYLEPCSMRIRQSAPPGRIMPRASLRCG